MTDATFPSVPGWIATLRGKILVALAGDPTGMAPYVRAIADGDDTGYFAENGPAWTVHAGMGTLVAGIRALLLQALHPGALAGVRTPLAGSPGRCVGSSL